MRPAIDLQPFDESIARDERDGGLGFKQIKLINKWYYDGHVRRSVASAAVRGLERHLRDAPLVDAGRRELAL